MRVMGRDLEGEPGSGRESEHKSEREMYWATLQGSDAAGWLMMMLVRLNQLADRGLFAPAWGDVLG